MFWAGFAGFCFWVWGWGGKNCTPYVNVIMLENLVRKYTRSSEKISFNSKPFKFCWCQHIFPKNQHFLMKMVPLLKAWELYLRFFSSVFSFCKTKGYCYGVVLQTMRPESGFRIAPTCPQIGKLRMASQCADMTIWPCFVFLVKFS